VGETVGPSQEETVESKPTEEYERTSPVRSFKKRKLSLFLTAALSAAIPVQHEQLAAAEIPPGSTWVEGIQTLVRGARSDRVETAGVFAVDNQSQRGKWIFNKQSLPEAVKFSTKDVGTSAAAEFSDTSTRSVTLCGLHTHPLRTSGFVAETVPAANRTSLLEGKTYVTIPPSMYDISPSAIELWQPAVQKLQEKGIEADMRFGVVDAVGITYYQPMTTQTLKQEYLIEFMELTQKRVIAKRWENTLNAILDNLDNATLDKLHPLAFRNVIYDSSLPKYASSSNPEIKNIKQEDIKQGLNDEYHREDIARELFAKKPKARKTYQEYIIEVVNKEADNQRQFYEAASNWVKLSLTSNPTQLPFTEQYKKLREAYAKYGVSIRFVPFQKVADEPPCAGTDYKPPQPSKPAR